MREIVNKDWVNGFLLAVILIGFLLAAFGVYRFIDTTIQLENNLAHQIRSRNETINPESTAQARGLVASDQERRGLVRQRFDGMIVGGAGLITVAVGWIAFDLVRGRRKKLEEATPLATQPTANP